MSENNRPYTNLDANQTITQSFDESIDAHRVINVAGTLPFVYDYGSLALSNGNTTETYTFKTGGASGTTVGTVVINYTSSTRDVLTNFTIAKV